MLMYCTHIIFVIIHPIPVIFLCLLNIPLFPKRLGHIMLLPPMLLCAPSERQTARYHTKAAQRHRGAAPYRA